MHALFAIRDKNERFIWIVSFDFTGTGVCFGDHLLVCTIFTVRNPLLLCPLVLAQDGGTRSRLKCLHRDFSATILFWVTMLGEAIFDIKCDF